MKALEVGNYTRSGPVGAQPVYAYDEAVRHRFVLYFLVSILCQHVSVR